MKAKVVLALAVWAMAQGASAQQWPSKPLRAILPFTPGGLADVVLRALSVDMGQNIGQPMLVENRGGAATMIGAEACAKAAPDGYTICLVAVDTTSITPFTMAKADRSAQGFRADNQPFFHQGGADCQSGAGSQYVQGIHCQGENEARRHELWYDGQ